MRHYPSSLLLLLFTCGPNKAFPLQDGALESRDSLHWSLHDLREEENMSLDRRLQMPESSDWEDQGCIGGSSAGIEAASSVSLSADGKKLVQGNFIGTKLYDLDDANGWTESMDFAPLLTDNGRGTYNTVISDDGKRVAVGSPNNAEKGFDSGAAQVFSIDDTTSSWTQIGRTMTGQNPGDYFGCAVDLTTDGNKVIVGAYGAGKSFVYEYFARTNLWSLSEVLVGDVEDAFGWDVAISGDGDRVIIGAPHANNRTGFARVKDIDTFKFVNQVDGLFPTEEYGTSVDFSQDGSTAALGGPGTGHVLVIQYDEAGNSWSRRGIRICIEDEAFGSSVSLSEDGMAVAIGAPLNDFFGPVAGHSYVFEYDPNSDWFQIGQEFHGENPFDECGADVGLSSDKYTTVVACPGTDTADAGVDAGQMCVYFRTDFWSPSSVPSGMPSISSIPTISSMPTVSSAPTISPQPSISFVPTKSSIPSRVPSPGAAPNVTPAPTKNLTSRPTGISGTSSPTVFVPTRSPEQGGIVIGAGPTISPQPSVSFVPTVSSSPTVSNKPTISSSPTVSNQPTISSSPTVSNQPTISLQPSVSSIPSTSSLPSDMPSSAPTAAGPPPGSEPVTVGNNIFSAVLALSATLGLTGVAGNICVGGSLLGCCFGFPILFVAIVDNLLFWYWEILPYWFHHYPYQQQVAVAVV